MHTTQWQVTTQPNFITKVKPTQWEKLPSRSKPKPTKKPIVSTIPHVKRPTSPSSAFSTTTKATATATTILNSLPQSTKPKPSQVLNDKVQYIKQEKNAIALLPFLQDFVRYKYNL